MDLFSFLATIILITSVVTLVVAVVAYIAYKIREARKPKAQKNAVPGAGSETPIFLQPAATDILLELDEADSISTSMEDPRREREANERHTEREPGRNRPQ
jgi:hypothetical protein